MWSGCVVGGVLVCVKVVLGGGGFGFLVCGGCVWGWWVFEFWGLVWGWCGCCWGMLCVWLGCVVWCERGGFGFFWVCGCVGVFLEGCVGG